MKPFLAIMHPRHIPECIDAFNALTIDRAWISWYPESDFREVIPAVIAQARARGFDRMMLLSDDTIPRQCALNAILKTHERYADAAVSGWCNCDVTMELSNVSMHKGIWESQPSHVGAYQLLTCEEVLKLVQPFNAEWNGFSALTATLDIWERIAFQNFHGNSCSDYWACKQLHDLGVPLVVEPLGFIYHVKERVGMSDQDPRKQLYIGRPREVRWEVR